MRNDKWGIDGNENDFVFLIYRKSLEEDERKESLVESKLLDTPNNEKHHSVPDNGGFSCHISNNKEENGPMCNNTSNV